MTERESLSPWRESCRAALEARLLQRWFSPAQSQPDLLARLVLHPLARLTGLLAARNRARVNHLPVDARPAVVIIGNLVVGGAGKTPLVAALARVLSSRGWQVGVVARGHRAALREARLVGPHDDARRHGDEPVLLARAAAVPVACAIERREALALLLARHPTTDIVLSDDGLQHAGLPRTLEIAVFDDRGAGNGRLLPAGPLREPLCTLAQMDAVLLRDPGTPTDVGLSGRLGLAGASKRSFGFTVEPVCFRRVNAPEAAALTIAQWRARAAGQRVHALAAIARPQRFFDTLRGCGIAVQSHLSCSDHAPARAELLPADAELIVMTAKDAVKFQDLADARCWYLEVAARIDPAFIVWLEESLRGSPTHRHPGLPAVQGPARV